MSATFALVRRLLAVLVGLVAFGSVASAQTTPNAATAPVSTSTVQPNAEVTPFGRYKECHGYVRHVSEINVKVHCIDGKPSDQSFVYMPKFAKAAGGKSVEMSAIKPDTPVHILYTVTLGVKKAEFIYIADPNGIGVFGFRS
jgi:hypothetical protein